MNNRELFVKDPLEFKILNEGVTSNNSFDEATLKYELSTFVCEGEYQDGLARILDGFLGNLGGNQKAVWVSGFYGSGKSHLVKVLRYLWSDHLFSDGTTARTLGTLPEDIKNKLKELSNKAKQAKTTLLSAGGTLRAGVNSVRLRLLGIVFKSLGIPEEISSAKLWLDLRKNGTLESVLAELRADDKEPAREFERIYSSSPLQKAYLKAHPDEGSLESVRKTIRDQYPAKVADISIDEMVRVLRQTLGNDTKKLPFTVIVLDEVQQFISSNPDIANDVQEAVEACCQMLDGRVLFVGTGQAALNETPSLQRLMGRFTVKVPLKDTDVQTVVRKVVLQKKDDKKGLITQEIESRSGEITRQLKTTRLATQADDKEVYVSDYPLLPVRRRFWERVLQHVDSTGTTAQMRTQLRVTHEACCFVAKQPVGTVIPGDFLYEQLAPDLMQSGEIQRRFSEIIEEQKKKPEGKLRSRLCSLIFLINKLPRQSDVDDGVRANVEHLADLLCDDLKAGVAELRQKLPALLDELIKDAVLMQVDGEYRLQTTEGASWEAEFRKRRSGALANEPVLASERAQVLQGRIQSDLSNIQVVHGSGKVGRTVTLHHGDAAPARQDGLVVWVRDGYSQSENSVMKDIQGLSQDDATIHVFVPKGGDLRNALADKMASQETISAKGNPTTPEGQEARKSIESKQSHAENQIKEQARSILSGARIYLSGGSEVTGDSTKDAVSQAAKKVVDRLYPRFHEADHANWHLVINKARQGNPLALEEVHYKGDADKYPVALEILQRVGGGLKGSDLIAILEAFPFGWSKDAVAGTINTLVVTGHLKLNLQGRELTHSELDHKKIAQSTLSRQHPVLTAGQLLKVKSLFVKAGSALTAGQEGAQAPHLVNKLKELAAAAGGEAPAPVAPKPPVLELLAGQSGNDLLFKLYENHESLANQIEQWKKVAIRLKPRLDEFLHARTLLDQAVDLPEAADLGSQLDAVVSARTLLDDPNPVAGIVQELTQLLQQALKAVEDQHVAVLAEQKKKLEAHPVWHGLTVTKQQEILAAQGLGETGPPQGALSLAESLVTANLDMRQTKVAALVTQFQKSLDQAIQAAEPKASQMQFQAATLKTPGEVDIWLENTKKVMLQALAQGPLIVS